MKIIVDKIGSVTKNVPLSHEVFITKKMVAEEGAVVAVEALQNKKFYNELELTSGRLSVIHKGDILIVALGQRRALRGFVGEVPSRIAVGDIIHVLNIGGVAGICTSANVKEVGRPLKVKVLGAVSDGKNSFNIKDFKLFDQATSIQSKIPLIVVSGTCMNVGKTSVACEIIKIAFRHRKIMGAAKVAGIAALKDTATMQDYGAIDAISVIDAGYPSTAVHIKESVAITKGAINYLAKAKPDYIILELGDGILGEYGVLEILKDKEFQRHVKAHIGCAQDPVGALKLFEICQDVGLPLDLISGPISDNSVGIEFIQKNLGIPSINGLSHGERIFPFLLKNCLK